MAKEWRRPRRCWTLCALGVSSVAVATAYGEFVNEAERKYLEVRGFTVTARVS